MIKSCQLIIIVIITLSGLHGRSRVLARSKYEGLLQIVQAGIGRVGLWQAGVSEMIVSDQTKFSVTLHEPGMHG